MPLMAVLCAPPLSVYVHLPWCVRKCPYCDFNSHEARAETPYAAYVDALLDDLAEEAGRVGRRPVTSVFFGGGTPSLCPPGEIGRFLDGLGARLEMAPRAEVTLEANPGTIEHGRFAEFAAAGVNRVSLGVQSFQPRLLPAIGRIHDDRQARAAVEELGAAGIENFNIDLMYGLPGQDVEQAVEDVRLAIESGAAHVSHYQLTLEPGTPFYRRPPPLPDEDSAWRMQEACGEYLAGAGFRHYEVSAWARPGRECLHNLNYWTFGDYIGLGAGAHGKLTRPDGCIVRRWKRRRPAAYLAGDGRLEGETFPGPGDLVFEFMLNALRLEDGFSWEDFEARTGIDRSRAASTAARATAAGLLETSPTGVRPSAAGKRFLNDLQSLFLPGQAPA
jgi:oxygen-independent coproporphyrinogen-3 oxidase